MKRFICLVFCLLSIISFATAFPARALKDGSYVWYEYWYHIHEYVLELGGPENISKGLTVNDIQGLGCKIQTSITASICQYNGDYDGTAARMRICFYFKCSGPEGYLISTQAEQVNFNIWKDAGGSNLLNQTIVFRDSDINPGFCQGYRLSKNILLSSIADDRLGLGLDALAEGINMALGLICPYATVVATAADLIVKGLAHSPQPSDHQDASIWGINAWSRWVNPHGVWLTDDPIEQYCFDSVDWAQYAEPDTYCGIGISAQVILSNDAIQKFGTDHLTIGPLYLYVFNEDYDWDGGEGCPTLLAWNGQDYVDYGAINIHNPLGLDVRKEVSIAGVDLSANDMQTKIRLREGWPGLNFSESVVDQVRLYAVSKFGDMYPCPLIRAYHSRLGDVTSQLRWSDDYRAQMLLLETVDLEFFVPYQNIQSYIFKIEGCNQNKM